jgi:hypothetical protein
MRFQLLALTMLMGILAACQAGNVTLPAPLGDDDYAEIPGLGATRIDVPRPTTPGRATCELALDTTATLDERVHGLREAGLFADRADLTDAELAAEIERELTDSYVGVDQQDPFVELLVAEQDPSRVWWADLEADVIDGNDVYPSVLDEWAQISVGAFAPSAIEESWAGPEGPVTVTFEHDGTTQSIEPAFLEDWIDPGIVVPINELIAPSGRRFELVKAFDQTAFVMALTEDERAALESRGWCFE